MARKTKNQSPETHDRESLRQIIKRIQDLLAPAIRPGGDPNDEKSRGAMEATGVEQLKIAYWSSMECAMRDLTRWARGMRDGMEREITGTRQI